jgi:hypothetical protein
MLQVCHLRLFPSVSQRAGSRHDRAMTSRAELSSLTASLDELTRRVTALAEGARGTHEEDLAADLFAVERSLTGALRRLSRLAEGKR